MERDRQEMVDVERSNHTAPLLAKQTVNAAKRELVSEPRAIAREAGVSLGSVAADVRLGGIEEGGHALFTAVVPLLPSSKDPDANAGHPPVGEEPHTGGSGASLLAA
jgi:hypothetical protein